MMSIRSLADFNRSSLGGDSDWLTPPPSPPRPDKPGRHGERGMRTFNWPPARTPTWPYTGTFSWPRTFLHPVPPVSRQAEDALKVCRDSTEWRHGVAVCWHQVSVCRRWQPAAFPRRKEDAWCQRQLVRTPRESRQLRREAAGRPPAGPGPLLRSRILLGSSGASDPPAAVLVRRGRTLNRCLVA